MKIVNDLNANRGYLNDIEFVKYFDSDINNNRFIELKRQNKIKDNLGYLANIQHLISCLKSGKNLVFLGNTGLGKTLCALEIAYRLKLEAYLSKSEYDGLPYSRENFINSYLAKKYAVYFARYNIMQSEFKESYSNLNKTLDSIFFKESFLFEASLQSKTRLVIIDEVHNASDFTLLNEVIFMAYDNLVPLLLIGNCNIDILKNSLSKMALSRLFENCEVVSGKGKDLRIRN